MKQQKNERNIKQYSFARVIKTKRSLIYVSLIATEHGRVSEIKKRFFQMKKNDAQRGMRRKKRNTVRLTHNRECREKIQTFSYTRNCLQTHTRARTHTYECVHI